MLNLKHNTMTTQINQILSTLTKGEIKCLITFIDLLYAEEGFSDVDVKDISDIMSITIPTVKGYIGNLTKKGIIHTGDADDIFRSLIFLNEEFYPLHPEWGSKEGYNTLINLLTSREATTQNTKKMANLTKMQIAIMALFTQAVADTSYSESDLNELLDTKDDLSSELAGLVKAKQLTAFKVGQLTKYTNAQDTTAAKEATKKASKPKKEKTDVNRVDHIDEKGNPLEKGNEVSFPQYRSAERAVGTITGFTTFHNGTAAAIIDSNLGRKVVRVLNLRPATTADKAVLKKYNKEQADAKAQAAKVKAETKAAEKKEQEAKAEAVDAKDTEKTEAAKK